MKVLYYNWVDYLDDERRGGGVSIYQRNLIRAWEGVEDMEAWFLSAGISYDLLGGRPRWERIRHGPAENRARRFEIVNSGTLAFAHHSFGAPAQVSHPATVAAVADFLDTHGPFDAVHFNNLEGLPAEVLGLQKWFPQTRFVLSLHNHYPFCPQVNLWFQERATCEDYAEGRNCTVCLTQRHDPRLVRLAHALAYRLKTAGIRPGTRLFDGVFRRAMRLGGGMIRRLRGGGAVRRRVPGRLRPVRAGRGADFVARRRAFVDLINAHCHRVLCVSDRVRLMAQRQGLADGLLQTGYIGTPDAARFAATPPRPSILRPDGTLGLGYLGYIRRDKGFYFLLDTLEAMPEALARRLHLVVAAPNTDDSALMRLRALSPRCASVLHADGYTHDTLDDILAQVDVGLVPVLWEDNLPQVALEMHARRIPLLTADLGGTQELSGCPGMVFPAGDGAALTGRIEALLEGRITARDYWSGPVRTPEPMAAHLEALRAVYAGRDGAAPDLSAREAPLRNGPPPAAPLPVAARGAVRWDA